jgi:hypothetical protein
VEREGENLMQLAFNFMRISRNNSRKREILVFSLRIWDK